MALRLAPPSGDLTPLAPGRPRRVPVVGLHWESCRVRGRRGVRPPRLRPRPRRPAQDVLRAPEALPGARPRVAPPVGHPDRAQRLGHRGPVGAGLLPKFHQVGPRLLLPRVLPAPGVPGRLEEGERVLAGGQLRRPSGSGRCLRGRGGRRGAPSGGQRGKGLREPLRRAGGGRVGGSTRFTSPRELHSVSDKIRTRARCPGPFSGNTPRPGGACCAGPSPRAATRPPPS